MYDQSRKYNFSNLTGFSHPNSRTMQPSQARSSLPHIPGAFNTQAAHLSRIKILLYGTSIPKKIFQTIQQQQEKFKIDAFAARHNHQLPKYWLMPTDPTAAVDAMNQP